MGWAITAIAYLKRSYVTNGSGRSLTSVSKNAPVNAEYRMIFLARLGMAEVEPVPVYNLLALGAECFELAEFAVVVLLPFPAFRGFYFPAPYALDNHVPLLFGF